MIDRFKDLEVFVRVVEAGSFSGAARTQGLSPSAVSKVIARLETRLGVRLFARSARAMTPTAEGRRLHEGAVRAIETLSETEDAVRADAQGIEGRLRIHCIPTFARYQLTPVIGRFRRLHPGVRLEFLLGTEPIDLFEQGIDLAIRSGRLASSSWIAKRIATSRWIVCAAPAYLAARGVPRTPEDLARHECLGFTMRTDWNVWPLKGARDGVAIRGGIGANHGDLLLDLARAGEGIVCLAAYHIQADLAAGRLVELLREHALPVEEPIYALRPPGRQVNRRAKLFLDVLEQSLSPPPWSADDAHETASRPRR